MGMQVWPEKVDWTLYRARFPSLEGGWCVPLSYEFPRDDSRLNSGWAMAYPRLKPYLSAKARKGLGLFTAATSTDAVDGVDFDKYEIDPIDLEEYGNAGVFLPDISPAQVNRVMKTFRSLSQEELVREIRSAWPKAFPAPVTNAYGFSNVEEYLAYLGDWEAVMEEVERDGSGLAFGYG